MGLKNKIIKLVDRLTHKIPEHQIDQEERDQVVHLSNDLDTIEAMAYTAGRRAAKEDTDCCQDCGTRLEIVDGVAECSGCGVKWVGLK